MPGFISDSPLARDLIRIGDEAIARDDDVVLCDGDLGLTCHSRTLALADAAEACA